MDIPQASSVDVEGSDKLVIRYHDATANEELSYQEVIALYPTLGEGGRNECCLFYIKRQSKENGTQWKLHGASFKEQPEGFSKDFIVSTLPSHLASPQNPDKAPTVHVIVSVRSGTCQAEQFFHDVILPLFDCLGFSEKHYQVIFTKSERSIIEFAEATLLKTANQGTGQTVLLLSGDGGVVDLVNVLHQSSRSPQYIKPTIGLLALGTGNALANSIGLNRDLTKGLRDFLRGQPHILPTFNARFSPGSELLVDEGRQAEPLPKDSNGFDMLYGAVVCSWALHASLVADSDTTEYRKYGAQRFQMAAKELLDPSDGSAPHRYCGRVGVLKRDGDGKETTEYLERGEHMYILATLVSNLEQALTISPESKPLDGQLRFLHFGVIPSDEVMRILGMAFAGGKHIGEKAVGYQSIEGLRIEFDEPDGRWRRVCVDGRIVRVGEGGWVEVRREVRDVLDVIACLQ
ncbi:hypothetical protein MMC14_004948 [Varicellaria rhodocarpa]|nr:hypothetical protein [Varicellaria rhodocarpa]